MIMCFEQPAIANVRSKPDYRMNRALRQFVRQGREAPDFISRVTPIRMHPLC
jgi:hypothetical protein